MRFLMSVLVVSLCGWLFVSAEETGPPKEEKQLLVWISTAPFDLSENPRVFREEYRADNEQFIEIPDFRDRKWFKPVVMGYCALAAWQSYNNGHRFRLRRINSEPSVSAGFTTGEGERVLFIPRSTPVIVFSIKGSLLAFQVTRKGGGFTLVIPLGSANPQRF